MNFLKSWLADCKNHSLKISSLMILLLLSLFATVFEMTGLSIFLPIFQSISNESVIVSNGGDLTSKIVNFLRIFGIKPTLISLLVFAFSLVTLRHIFNYFKAIYTAKINFSVVKSASCLN